MVFFAEIIAVEVGRVERQTDEDEYSPEEAQTHQFDEENDPPKNSRDDQAPPEGGLIDEAGLDLGLEALEVPALLLGFILAVPPAHPHKVPAGDVLNKPEVHGQ